MERSATADARQRIRHRMRQRLKLLLIVAVVLVMTVWAVWHGSALIRADFTSMAARDKVDRWARARSGWTVDEWKSVRADLQKALQITPDDPVLHDTLAQLYVTQGLVAWADPEQREAYFDEARQHQEASLRLRPGDGPAWANLAVSLFALNRTPAEMQRAWNRARLYAPQEWPVQTALIDLSLATWDQATPEMREWTLQNWRAAAPDRKAVIEATAKRRGRIDVLR